MRAAVLKEIKKPLEIVNVPDPIPGKGEVVVELKYAALNHRDLWIQQGLYPNIRKGVILGSDGAGMIGSQTVVINPSINWGKDQKAQGPHYEILGNPRNGTLAQKVAVPKKNVYPKPAHLDIKEAGAFALIALTAYRALFVRGKLSAGERVLVTGIGGGVAIAALQMAVAVGAEVWVTSSSQEKIDKAKKLGAVGGFLYSEWGWEKKVRESVGGFDLIVDGASGPQLALLVDLCKPGGRIVIYGQTAGNVREFSMARVFWRQLSILGTSMGSDRDFVNMLKFWEKHRLHPVIDSEFPLSAVNRALERMAKGLQFGKIIIDVSR